MRSSPASSIPVFTRPFSASVPARMASTLPKSCTSFDAVFSPTPGTPGMLSDASPFRATYSRYFSGGRPNRSVTAASSYRTMSEIPFRLNITVMPGRTSWKKSRSAVTITVSMPRSRARTASVAMASSASCPSTSTIGIRSVSTTSRISGSCCLKSSGVSRLPALYSAYCASRTVGLPLSNATAIRSGCSSPSSLMSMEVNPNAAFVTCPLVVASVGGSAK